MMSNCMTRCNCWAMTSSCRCWPLSWVTRWHGVSASLFNTSHSHCADRNLIEWNPNPFSDKPHQSGLAKSGLSIRGAINLLRSIAFFKTPSIVINVGSIDIMLGRNLVDMRSDYNELVDLCEKRNIQPIITTLAPLANNCHPRDMRNKLLMFNSYLRDKFYSRYRVINLWSQLVTPRGRTRFEYFEPYVNTIFLFAFYYIEINTREFCFSISVNRESVYVTGSNQAHVLWNKIGRQIILDHIKTNL